MMPKSYFLRYLADVQLLKRHFTQRFRRARGEEGGLQDNTNVKIKIIQVQGKN